MSGKRMVSSVQITLVPPWRPETARNTQRADTERPHQEQRAQPRRLPQTAPPPPPEEPWTESQDFLNEGKIFPCPPELPSLSRQHLLSNHPGGSALLPQTSHNVPPSEYSADPPSFPRSYLDDIPPVDDFLSQDILPPPPPAPVMMKVPKHGRPDRPPAPPMDSLSLELQKLDLVYAPEHPKPNFKTPGPLNPQKSIANPSTQQRREEPAPGKQGLNGHTAKPNHTDICAFCHKAILPHVAGIEAMKKQYHADCFTCRKCHRLLAGQLYYKKDSQPICEHCYKDTLEKCAKCQTMILQHIVRAMGNGYHPECFTCVVCQRRIADESFAVDEYNDVHCAEDYYRKYAPICSACDEPIIPREGQDSYKIECLGRNFHENCYRCEKCHITLSLEPTDNGCYPLKDHMLCKSCHLTWKDGLC